VLVSGEERDRLAALIMCHADVQVCPVCVGWLRSRLGIIDSTPILPVLDSVAAVAFYEHAGFDVRRYEGGDYGFVSVDDESVFDLDQVDKLLDATTNRSACYLIVSDVDEWYERFTNLKLDVTPLENKPWEMREFSLTDPSGNSLRFGSPLGDDE
jgi:hypothetical protein